MCETKRKGPKQKRQLTTTKQAVCRYATRCHSYKAMLVIIVTLSLLLFFHKIRRSLVCEQHHRCCRLCVSWRFSRRSSLPKSLMIENFCLTLTVIGHCSFDLNRHRTLLSDLDHYQTLLPDLDRHRILLPDLACGRASSFVLSGFVHFHSSLGSGPCVLLAEGLVAELQGCKGGHRG